MDDLRNRAGKAFAWDFAGNYGSQLFGFLISIFLTRLLEPEDFGLIGISMVFISVLGIFTDMGFSSALIQQKKNSALACSSIFYINILAGVFLTLSLCFSAPFIGDFYNNDQITLLVRLLSITFFLSSFNIVQAAMLKKSLAFKSLTIRDLSSQVIAGIIAIIFAWHGYGVYALVIQQIIASIIRTLLLWRIAGWYPQFKFSWTEVKQLTGFSLYVFASQSINQLIMRADTLIVGKLFSPTTLGFYSRANTLNYLVNKSSVSSIAKVFFPTLSIIREHSDRFERVFLKTIGVVSSISIILSGVLFLSAHEVITGLFGAKWEPSVPIFEILIIKGFTYPINAMIVNGFLAQGKSRENFHYGNVRKVLQLAPLLIALIMGFYPFLYSLVIINVVGLFFNVYISHRSLKINFKKQLAKVLPDLIVAFFLVVIILLLLPNQNGYLLALARTGIFSIAFCIWLWLTKSDLFLEMKYYLNYFLSRKND